MKFAQQNMVVLMTQYSNLALTYFIATVYVIMIIAWFSRRVFCGTCDH